MGRRPQPEIREHLLDACTSYALECGLPDRMGPLAAAAGTSTRMLVYHFGTRDLLLREVLGRARRRQLEAFGQMLRLRPNEPYLDTLARAWEQMTGPRGSTVAAHNAPLGARWGRRLKRMRGTARGSTGSCRRGPSAA
jgi:AcrR family transcriptional regulator